MKTIAMLKEANDKIAKSSNNIEIFTIIEDLVMDISQSDYAEFYLFDFDKQILYSDINDTIHIGSTNGLLGYTISTQQPAFYNYIVSSKHYISSVDNPMAMSLKSQMIIPVIENDAMIALLRLSRSTTQEDQYTQQNLQMLLSVNHFFIAVSKIIAENRTNKTINLDKDNAKIINANQPSPSQDINGTMMFLANTVHDIRTPTNSLYGFLELLEYEITDKRLKKYISNAKDSAKFISTLTDSILGQIKQTHQAQTSKHTTVNTIKYFTKIANIFTARMSDKKINYVIYLDPKMPKEIRLDELKLKRVLINLIGNAYKFTPVGKAITFSVEFDATSCLFNISVSDEGIGIAKNRQQEIFEAFTQAEDDTSVNFGGTGLGLSISAQYVDSLGGKLELESELDQGSKFYFSIPIEIVDNKPAVQDFFHKDRVVNILVKDQNDLDALNIQRYLLGLGLAKEAVVISNQPYENITDLICFEDCITNELLSNISNYEKVVFVEDKLLSLIHNPKCKNRDINSNNSFDDKDVASSMSRNLSCKDQNILSRNSFYGEDMRDMLYYLRKKRVLIVDDNRLNISLLTLMMESENVDVTSIIDAKMAFGALVDAHENGHDFDILFIDDQMPDITGSEIVAAYREYEKDNDIDPIFMVSTSGNPIISDEIKSKYNLMIGKPFSKQAIHDAIGEATRNSQ